MRSRASARRPTPTLVKPLLDHPLAVLSLRTADRLDPKPLPLVLAVFMGWLPKFGGNGHGENCSKLFTLKNQGNKLQAPSILGIASSSSQHRVRPPLHRKAARQAQRHAWS